MAAPTPQPNEGGFRDRCVADAVLAELVHQAFRDLKNAARGADIFAHQEDAVVARHLLAHGLIQGFSEGKARYAFGAGFLMRFVRRIDRSNHLDGRFRLSCRIQSRTPAHSRYSQRSLSSASAEPLSRC